MTDLNGKVALVTGATGSINEEIVRRLHAAGAAVLITGIQDSEGAAIATSLGERAIYQRMDLRSDEDIDAALRISRKAFGRLDFVINAACTYTGSHEGSAMRTASDPTGGLSAGRAEWLESLDVNLIGHAILIQKSLDYLTQPGGVVVNIGSVAGKVGSYDTGPYPASKAALLHLTKAHAVALGQKGIRVVSVSPGWTADSPPALAMSEGSLEKFDRACARVTPLGNNRGGRMKEVADVVVFACSTQASWIHGCDIPVDGGFTIWAADRGYGPQWWVDQTS